MKPETGKTYLTTTGEAVQLLQQNAVTYLVKHVSNPFSKPFHILHEELSMNNEKPAFNPNGSNTVILRKSDAPGRLKVEQRYFVNGRTLEEYTPDELYDLIKHAEQEIADMRAIQHRPALLVQEQARRENALKVLVLAMDAQLGQGVT